MLKTSSSKSLKQRNQPQLLLFFTANAILLAVAIAGSENVSVAVKGALSGEVSAILRLLTLPSLGGLMVGLVSWMVPRHWKEVIVFWRPGARSLPSSEAFSALAPADPRISMAALEARLGPLPTEHEKQSALWYSVYRKHIKDLSVEDANAAYLLYREMAAAVPTLVLGLSLIAPFFMISWKGVVLALAGLIVEYLMTMFAARNAGRRLVANVLALESARPQKPESGSESKPPGIKEVDKPKVPRVRKKAAAN